MIIFAIELFTFQLVQVQGMTYLFNLEYPSIPVSAAVGSDSWLAASFKTGTNSGGYALDSVQLALADASGNPNGFTVMLYSALPNGVDFSPGANLGDLNGSVNPTTGGIYTYVTGSDMMLLPDEACFIVLTAGTTVTNGAYNWNLAGQQITPVDGWQAPALYGGVDNYQSANGSSWSLLFPPNPYFGANPQFAITAAPIPEPSLSWLLLLGSGVLFYVRRNRKILLDLDYSSAGAGLFCRKADNHAP